MISDFLTYALRTFKRRKVRSFLTMLGIFIGIAAIVSLVSLGQGLQQTITEQFEQMGVDKIMIYPGVNSFVPGIGGAGIELREKDIETVRDVRGVDVVGGMLYKLGKLKFGDEVQYAWVIGLPQDDSKEVFNSMMSLKVEKGRDLRKNDRYRSVVGVRLADADFFDKAVRVGDKIEIEDKEIKVVGILGTIGNPEDDSSILIPLETGREIFNEPDVYSSFIVQVKKGFDPDKVAGDIKKYLRKSRGQKEGEEDFTVQTSEQLAESFSTVFTIVQVVLIGLASISLLVGGIGIMNTMFTSVLERTREIGVMKAIGARNSDIMKIFLIEAGLLCTIGGGIGIILGIGISKLIQYVAAQAGMGIIQAYFPWYLIVGALAFSFLVGTLSGIFPARRAAKLKPVDALRYE